MKDIIESSISYGPTCLLQCYTRYIFMFIYIYIYSILKYDAYF